MLIAQLSDPHLRPPGALYQDVVDSNAMFDAAVRQVNALNPDLVLLSGDLVDKATPEEYAHARKALSVLRSPLLAIPGNHDDRDRFRSCFSHHPPSGPLHFASGDHGPVRIVGLDVTVPGAHHGDMTQEACQWLEETLDQDPDRPTILMMHQPPFESGIPYIDKYNCKNGEALAAILRRYTNIERVVCGHIHRSMQIRFGGTMLVTAPSTTTAIALRLDPSAKPASFVEPPAFLLHHWTPRGGLITHFVPIGTFPGPFDFF
jgi:3',5'-cyclic AMP phosphodiesterase CpdA